ncbi:c-type cytochrome [Chryseobacterium tongliaoense]|uniref:c-type cytochrome n=1 Tax=Chryseobacterium tongliaoense TaxID=3240933 RepID=UPI0035193E89
MKKIVYTLLSAILTIACSSRTYDDISEDTPIADQVKYAANVKVILDNNCVSCHSAGSFKPLTTYNDVRNNIDAIINRIQRPNGDPLKMPPGGSLSQTQINTFIKWKTDGFVEQ